MRKTPVTCVLSALLQKKAKKIPTRGSVGKGFMTNEKFILCVGGDDLGAPFVILRQSRRISYTVFAQTESLR